ncbi:hypothetical protein [Streptomyces caatingaensis]|uniref:Uncharacterized protein n=1 Tax=Streptomyces caatingaensis TaxID=1678637 RepID=A0A0K9XKP0_9ACTN|nr:hypothetical protein [Streptomyces caatingaensis]KNB53217.1 hypothetical protein AC230_07150 [Streptomyces caatingaensis]
MTDDPPPRDAADEPRDRPDFGYTWVTACGIGEFVRRMQAIREGERPVTDTSEPPRPATAMRALHAFAVGRPTADLIEAAQRGHFGYRDAVSVLATAALCRSVKEAAELTSRQWEAESGPDGGRTPKTDDIVRDIARQRTVPDVAAFVRECRRLGGDALVAKTLRAFTDSSSGRRNSDKAMLYVALRDEECDEEAAELLSRTLAAVDEDAAAHPAGAGPAARLDDLVGALHEISPSERILERWIDGQLRDLGRVEATIRLVVRLLAGRPTGGPDPLTEHIGRHWGRYEIVPLCDQLARHAPEQCAAVRRHVAARTGLRELAEIVADWRSAEGLAKTVRELLKDIVATGTAAQDGPRPVADLDGLAQSLRHVRADPECGRLLRLVAAEHVDGRPGEEIAALLHRVERRGDRWRAARTIAERLTALALGADSEVAGVVVGYLTALREARDTHTIDTTLKEIADASHSGHDHRAWVTLVTVVAGRLYRSGLTADATNLLERCLENEQRITPEDVGLIVGHLRDAVADPAAWRALLSATVGRWTDAHLRDGAVRRLRQAGFDAEAAAVSC